MEAKEQKRKVALIVDSSCDLPIEIIEKYRIIVVPISIMFPNETRTQYIDISSAEFFELLVEKDLPASTGVPPPKRFLEAFERALEQSDEVLMLTLSNDLSGIHQSAKLHAKKFTDNKVTVVDVRTTTLAFGLIAYKVAQLIEQGSTKAQILDRLQNKFIPNSRLNAFVGNLKYLKRSGRIATLQHLLGELFQFKPLIAIEDGKIISPRRFRGDKAKLRYLKSLGERLVEALPEHETIIIAHSRNVAAAEEIATHLRKFMPTKSLELLVWEIGPAIGVHVGPGALGLTWIGPHPDDLLK